MSRPLSSEVSITIKPNEFFGLFDSGSLLSLYLFMLAQTELNDGKPIAQISAGVWDQAESNLATICIPLTKYLTTSSYNSPVILTVTDVCEIVGLRSHNIKINLIERQQVPNGMHFMYPNGYTAIMSAGQLVRPAYHKHQHQN